VPRRDHRPRAADDELAGHDLTYLAEHGLVSPPEMPPTLFADMAGAERAVSTALALVIARDRTGRGASQPVALAERRGNARAAAARRTHARRRSAGRRLRWL
jgi:crotonobetainyl-CoA:carnitine CoA-transferase CaiB-like acyl-CoA transferase